MDYFATDRGMALLSLEEASFWRKAAMGGWNRKLCLENHRKALDSARRYRAYDSTSPFQG